MAAGVRPEAVTEHTSPNPGVDYDGQLSRAYELGREISSAAQVTWKAAVEPHIARGATAVDIGAGTGRFARLLTDFDPGRLVAVEPAAGMRRIGMDAARGLDIEWVCSRAEQLALRSESVDVLWSAFTTHYFDLLAAGAEFARVLKTGGRLLIWNGFPEIFDELEWYRWFPQARRIDEARVASAAQVSDIFEGAGLALVEQSTHQKLIADDLGALADRLSHRAISGLRLIDDDAFDTGLRNLRDHAAQSTPSPVYGPTMLLVFERS